VKASSTDLFLQAKSYHRLLEELDFATLSTIRLITNCWALLMTFKWRRNRKKRPRRSIT